MFREISVGIVPLNSPEVCMSKLERKGTASVGSDPEIFSILRRLSNFSAVHRPNSVGMVPLRSATLCRKNVLRADKYAISVGISPRTETVPISLMEVMSLGFPPGHEMTPVPAPNAFAGVGHTGNWIHKLDSGLGGALLQFG